MQIKSSAVTQLGTKPIQVADLRRMSANRGSSDASLGHGILEAGFLCEDFAASRAFGLALGYRSFLGDAKIERVENELAQ